MSLLGFAILLFLVAWAHGTEHRNVSAVASLDNGAAGSRSPLLVGLTLIQTAAAKGAVCLDGSLPGYHLHRGYGSGANSWVINLEGGGWCNEIKSCAYRKMTHHGSSDYMEKLIEFSGLLSDKLEENPDFYNWNRVKIRYCDGASFMGEGYRKAEDLYFRADVYGRLLWKNLWPTGCSMLAFLSGCSAGGLATIFHCDNFRALFPRTTKVKCLADAGLFLDVVDVAGGHTMRSFYSGVIRLQGVWRNLPRTCTAFMDATSCFFPQNMIGSIQTPLFLLNSAYDVWQLQESIAPKTADPFGYWNECRMNHANCNAEQIQFLQGFRDQMLNAVRDFSSFGRNGLFINSCFAHCQSEKQGTWFASNSPLIDYKRIATAVGDWFFDRTEVNAVDCAYPCDETCHHIAISVKERNSKASIQQRVRR